MVLIELSRQSPCGTRLGRILRRLVRDAVFSRAPLLESVEFDFERPQRLWCRGFRVSERQHEELNADQSKKETHKRLLTGRTNSGLSAVQSCPRRQPALLHANDASTSSEISGLNPIDRWAGPGYAP